MILCPTVPPPADAQRLTAADASNVVMDAHDQVNVFLLAGNYRVIFSPMLT